MVEEKIIKISNVGIGTRVSIDLIDELKQDEGLLIGNTMSGFVLVLSEFKDTEYAPARPFRINCGSIHQYIYIDEDKVRYLSEIRPGDLLTVVSKRGKRQVAVGRIKKEKREMKRIELGNNISATLQDVETLNLLNEKPLRLIDCKINDNVLVKKGNMSATHRGERVEEYIEEI